MATAVKTVGVVLGAAALIATGVGAFAVAGSALAGVASTVATIGTIGSVAANIASQALAPGIKPPPARGSVSQLIVDPDAPQPYVMGEGYYAGVLRHRTGYGGTVDDVPNPYLFDAVVYSGGGPVQGIAPRVDFGAVPAWYSGYLYTDVQTGAVPESSALALHWAGAPGWTSAHKLSGQAAIGWNFKFDKAGKKFASGLPVTGAEGQWVKCYDPRKDSTFPGGSGTHRLGDESTYEWTDSPALHAGQYAYGRYQNGKRTFGMGLPAEGVDWQVVAAWANTCEANSWRMFGVIYEPGNRWQNLIDICAAGGAEPVPGAILSFRYQAPRVALDTITEADIADADSSVCPMQSYRDRINIVVPKRLFPTLNWELLPDEAVSVPEYIAEDGEERPQEWPFNFVKDAAQAAQLAAYKLVDAREIHPIELTCMPRLRGYRPGDCLHLDLPQMGLDHDAIILHREFDPARMTVKFILMSETPSKHAYALGQEGATPPSPALVQTAQERDETASEVAVGQPGPEGPQGPEGPEGPQGPAGEDGVADQEVLDQLNADIAAANSAIDDAEADIAAAQGQISDLLGDMAQAQADILSAGGEIDTLQSDVSTIGANVSTNATAISNLQGNYAGLTQTVTALRAQQRASTFNDGADAWVWGYAYAKSALPTTLSVVEGYTAVTLEPVAGLGTVLQCDGIYRVMSERATRPIIEGEKVRVRIRTRLTQDPDPASGAHTQYTWMVGHGVDGAYIAYSGLTTWTGLTVADGWVTREFTFTPSSKAAPGLALENATEWRLMVGLNGFDDDAGGAIQQIQYIEIDSGMLTEVAASVTLQAQALSDLDSDFASLQSDVSTMGANVSQNATAISTLDSNYAGLSITVQALSARGGLRNSNSGFDDYPAATGLPPNWVGWTGAGPATLTRVADTLGGYSMQAAAAAGSNLGFATVIGAPGEIANNDYVVIVADVTLNSGTFAGAGFMFRMMNAATTGLSNAYFPFSTLFDSSGVAPGNGTAEKRYQFSKLFKVDQATASRAQVYGINHHTNIGSVAAANNITWHELGWRPATTAEIAAGVVLFDIAAQVTTQADALDDLDTQYANLSSDVSTMGANVSQNATAITTLDALATVTDTRNDDQPPQWYWTNYPRRTVKEFKTKAALGIPAGPTYGVLTTTVPYPNSGGGDIQQIYVSQDESVSYSRRSSGSTSVAVWTAWKSYIGELNSDVGDLQTDYATLSSDVSTNGVNISSNLTAITSVQGDVTTLFGKAGVTVNVNGVITGWETNNNGENGDFNIYAPIFRVSDGSPGGIVPFQIDDGKVRIQNARINEAQIDDLTVSTIKVAGGALSSFADVSVGSQSTTSASYVTIASLTITPFSAESKYLVLIGVAGRAWVVGASPPQYIPFNVRLLNGPTNLASTLLADTDTTGLYSAPSSYFGVVTGLTGATTLNLQYRTVGGSQQISLSNASIVVVELKR